MLPRFLNYRIDDLHDCYLALEKIVHLIFGNEVVLKPLLNGFQSICDVSKELHNELTTAASFCAMDL
jgi:hypothetical protein